MSTTPDLDSLLKQAQRCVRKGRYAEAVEMFQEAIRLDDKRPDTLEGLATAHFLAEDYEQAAEAFTRLTELTPRLAKPFINLGAVYNRMGEYLKAADALRRALQRDKKSSEAYYNMGIAYRRMKEYGMAVTAYKEALRLNPQMAEAVQNLANVYLEMGNHQQAMTEYRRALEIRPDFEKARAGLKKAEQAAVEAKKAVSPFGRLVGEAPPQAKAGVVAKNLSEQQRREDRQALHELSVDIVAYGKDFLAAVRDELEPALLALNRTLLIRAEEQLEESLPQTHADFQAALARCRERRAILKGKILELKSHEEYINAED